MTEVVERRNTVEKKGEGKYVAWLKGRRGPEAQLWCGDQRTGAGQFQKGAVKPWDQAEVGELVAFFEVETIGQLLWSLGELITINRYRYEAPVVKKHVAGDDAGNVDWDAMAEKRLGQS